jgi:hypothetical protein
MRVMWCIQTDLNCGSDIQRIALKLESDLKYQAVNLFVAGNLFI